MFLAGVLSKTWESSENRQIGRLVIPSIIVLCVFNLSISYVKEMTDFDLAAKVGIDLAILGRLIVAVIGILTAIVMPMYQDSMRKSRRTDAMRDLMELASRQERFYAQNSVYTADIATEFGLNLRRTTSEEEHYNLSVIQCTRDGTTLSLDNCYVLQATPLPGSDQEKDTNCAILRVDALGERTATGTQGDKCW